MAEEKLNIKKAIKKPGALRKALGVKKGKRSLLKNLIKRLRNREVGSKSQIRKNFEQT